MGPGAGLSCVWTVGFKAYRLLLRDGPGNAAKGLGQLATSSLGACSEGATKFPRRLLGRRQKRRS
jgi:hypothetical protein